MPIVAQKCHTSVLNPRNLRQGDVLRDASVPVSDDCTQKQLFTEREDLVYLANTEHLLH